MRFLFTLPGVPRRLISRFAGACARLPLPSGLRGPAWSFLAARFGIERKDVPGKWSDYRRFLDVFTRSLPEGARPVPPGKAWLSPADGTLIECTQVNPEGTWVIKGTPYSTAELLPEMDGRRLDGYRALQIYLAPMNYHRYHSPCSMEVLEAVVMDGDLQPVDPKLARRALRVLARNRRVLLHCRSMDGEYFSMLFVGAMNVGRMVFDFDPSLCARPICNGRRLYDPPPVLEAGQEMGRFELGSTIVLFTPPDRRPLAGIGDACRARTPLLGAGPAVEN